MSTSKIVSSGDRRIDSEKEFHNRKFSDHASSGGVGRYSIQSDLFEFYERNLRKLSKGASVLEYGCGPHSWAGVIMDAGAKSVTGIDISEEAIAISKRRFETKRTDTKFDFHVMNAEKLEFPDASFDLVAGVAILHHLKLDVTFAELSRVLVPGGAAIFLEPMGHNPLINAFRYFTPSLRTPDEHPLLKSDLRDAEKFFKVRADYFTLFPICALPLRPISSKLFNATVQTFQSVDKVVFKALPAIRRQAWSVGLIFRKPLA